MNSRPNDPHPSRRAFLRTAALLSAAFALPRRTHADIADSVPVVREITGGATAVQARVTLELPRLADNGNMVSLRVAVAAPRDGAESLRDLYLLAEKNPRPLIAHFRFGPRVGKPEIATRIRLAGTQRVVALARLADGSWWFDQTDIAVTEAACYEGS